MSRAQGVRCRWRHVVVPFLLASIAAAADAQTVLPPVDVTAKDAVEHYGGYVISGDFRIDPRMSAVIYPAEALQEGDILSVEPVRLADDEYFVLEECSSADCTQARILRVWGAFGATTDFHDPHRMMIPHEGKFFLWMSRIEPGAAPPEAGIWFTEFQRFGPPLILSPIGLLASYSTRQIAEAQAQGPVKITKGELEGVSFAATFATGSVVRLKRMHAAH
jgi:hypothetical protein